MIRIQTQQPFLPMGVMDSLQISIVMMMILVILKPVATVMKIWCLRMIVMILIQICSPFFGYQCDGFGHRSRHYEFSNSCALDREGTIHC